VGSVQVGGHDVANFDLVVGDDDAIDQQFYEGASLLERGAPQSGCDSGAELFDGGRDGRHVQVLPRAGIHLALLSSEDVETAVEVALLVLECIEVQDAGHVGIQESSLLSLDLPDCLLEGGAPGHELTR
jgi:hypothetical protein